jgi:transcriptional regulator with XRE-family HTH domain
VNENLRRAMLRARLSEEDVAVELQVDPKTVRRWLEGRVPYLRHRWLLANLLGAEEADLWLNSHAGSRPPELRAVYPNRQAMPHDAWLSLFGSAEREIGILDHSALFLAKEPTVLSALSDRAHYGARLRICLRNRSMQVLAENDASEGSNGAVSSENREALNLFWGLRPLGAEIRLHRSILYNAIYRADNHLLVTQHVYGVPDDQQPVLFLRSAAAGDMATAYIDTFERIWASALRM